MYRLRPLIYLLLLLTTVAKAQTTPAITPADSAALRKLQQNPKREFRGVWVATVDNIDWPKPHSTVEQQKQQLIDILDQHQRTGLNAVIFQIRPAADAFYSKGREPWSKWLMGKQGQIPTPFYDPLEFAITEAHKRGLELHAWFNPYRATNDANYGALSADHITRQHPEWFFTYGGLKTFNPGLPEVREYIVRVILDVVENYNIDAVHMDDYFYPYQIAGQKINDADAYQQYGTDFSDIRDWRRENVNKLIKMLSDSIHAHKPRVKFGISPFGIWANKAQNAEGSDTRGGDSYYELYADSRKWVQEGWVDYINPQLYWPLGYSLAPFENLLSWWSENTYNRHLYIGQAAYRINERRATSFKHPEEIPDEIKLLRTNPRVQGSVFFSSQSLTDNKLGFTDSLRLTYYKHPALPPPMLWLDSIAPNAPQNVKAVAVPNTTRVLVTWDAPLEAQDHEPVYGYVVYRFEGTEKIDISTSENIMHIQYDPTASFIDTTAQRGKTYLYVVTAIDQTKNESDRSPAVAIKLP
ncbi:glycoside hydrolase family 10 protein [Mucilaginibacter panaciglaebae]|uniref:glycoside hydrolase family 10 protein n=1 Tax=Mucilaginibacter panaciglaebae TaxID=502331 RepID=UPI0031E4F137